MVRLTPLLEKIVMMVLQEWRLKQLRVTSAVQLRCAVMANLIQQLGKLVMTVIPTTVMRVLMTLPTLVHAKLLHVVTASYSLVRKLAMTVIKTIQMHVLMMERMEVHVSQQDVVMALSEPVLRPAMTATVITQTTVLMTQSTVVHVKQRVVVMGLF
jgi:hypothetical protein